VLAYQFEINRQPGIQIGVNQPTRESCAQMVSHKHTRPLRKLQKKTTTKKGDFLSPAGHVRFNGSTEGIPTTSPDSVSRWSTTATAAVYYNNNNHKRCEGPPSFFSLNLGNDGRVGVRMTTGEKE
jgi:hypothetical protein